MNMNAGANRKKSFGVAYTWNPQLKLAVQNANIECVEKLIANGADVYYISRRRLPEHKDGGIKEVKWSKMVTPLIHSIFLLHPKSPQPSNVMMDIFNLLLKSGADVNTY